MGAAKLVMDKPEFQQTEGFQPQFTDFERFMFALYAYSQGIEEFNAKVRAIMNLRRYPDKETVFARDDGSLEGQFKRLKRLATDAENLYKKCNLALLPNGAPPKFEISSESATTLVISPESAMDFSGPFIES